MADGIGPRLVAEVMTRWGLSRADATGTVRYVLAEVVDDLRRCQQSLTDDEWRMGVRIAASRLEWGDARIGGKRSG